MTERDYILVIPLKAAFAKYGSALFYLMGNLLEQTLEGNWIL